MSQHTSRLSPHVPCLPLPQAETSTGYFALRSSEKGQPMQTAATRGSQRHICTLREPGLAISQGCTVSLWVHWPLPRADDNSTYKRSLQKGASVETRLKGAMWPESHLHYSPRRRAPRFAMLRFLACSRSCIQ